MAEPVWFWRRVVSPHIAGLASGLAARGIEVVYVAEQRMSADRSALGWEVPELAPARLRLAPDRDAVAALVREAPANSIHLCEGFRGNGLIGTASKMLAGRRLRRWIALERVEDPGLAGALKRRVYDYLARRQKGRIEGVLAIGDTAAQWYADRGNPAERIFPFAHFPAEPVAVPATTRSASFRFLYVGQFIERKRIGLLIDAIADLANPAVDLTVVGSGPLEGALHDHALRRLGGRVRWLGVKPTSEVPALMAEADCLLLPSRFDGWGAVVSEAMLVGTPAVCSDRCGVASVVRASGEGGVFPYEDAAALRALLARLVEEGPPGQARRDSLARWATCLGAAAGAEYLEAILHYAAGRGPRPVPPWEPVG